MGDVAAPALGSDFGGLQVRRGGGDSLGRVAVAAVVGNRGGRASLKCGSSLCRSSQLRGSDLTVGEGAKKGARGKSCWRLCESAYLAVQSGKALFRKTSALSNQWLQPSNRRNFDGGGTSCFK